MNNETQYQLDSTTETYTMGNDQKPEIKCNACKWQGATNEIVMVSDGGEWLNTCPNCGSTKIDYL